MSYLDSYKFWRDNKFFDEDTRRELSKLVDEKEIEDRFYQDLEFGTAGLRGVMGAGTNRMNKYTVGKASAGFGKYLLQTFGEEACKTRGVVISYDTRNNSDLFSKQAADVFSSLGIKVYLCAVPSPIPVLSYSIRKLGAVGGVMITASHNPKEYNGYKVYDARGCQLVDEAKKVTACVNTIDDYSKIDFSGNKNLIEKIDLTDEFVSVILGQSRVKDKDVKSSLKVVYTPLHGSGYIPVKKALEKDGFTQVEIVKEQAVLSGDFPTVVSPNPEDRRALELGIKLAENIDADIVLGTDPDCDRVGVAVKTDDGYKLLTGNHTGSLLMDFILNNTDLTKFEKPAVISTIVTSELGSEIARKRGAKVFLTLTGFKYIGERMNLFEDAKAVGDKAHAYDYIYGYEESYGSLTGTHARDKDAVIASMLIAEMAAFYKAQGKTLIDRLNELYEEFGYYLDTQDNFTLKGKEGLEKIASMMTELRTSAAPFENVKAVVNYSSPVPAEEGFGNLPTANVIKYIFEDGSWVVVRPSGTEPKIKIYYSIKGDDQTKAEARLEKLRVKIKSVLGLN